MNAHSPPVAGIVAGRTAAPLGEPGVLRQAVGRGNGRWRQIGVLARLAYLPYQALRDHARQGRRQKIGFDAHVHHSRQRSQGIVGMQRGQHQVSGQRRLHGDERGLLVADLSHHDDVRVLAQDVLQHLGETQSDGFADRVLVDVVELVFDRILDRDDVLFDAVQIIDGGVQRGGLAAAGRAADQDQSVAAAEQFLEQLQIGLPHAELLDVEDRLVLVQHPQHHLFAVDARHRAEAQVDGASLRHDLNAAVLRHAPLRDIEVGHDL